MNSTKKFFKLMFLLASPILAAPIFKKKDNTRLISTPVIVNGKSYSLQDLEEKKDTAELELKAVKEELLKTSKEISDYQLLHRESAGEVKKLREKWKALEAELRKVEQDIKAYDGIDKESKLEEHNFNAQKARLESKLARLTHEVSAIYKDINRRNRLVLLRKEISKGSRGGLTESVRLGKAAKIYGATDIQVKAAIQQGIGDAKGKK